MTDSSHSIRRALRLACAASVVVFAGTAFAGPTNVPFSGQFSTQETLGFDPTTCPAFPFLKGTTTGNGIATQLGAATGLASDCIMPPPPGGSQFQFSNGTLTLTAANGDQVTIAYGGTLTPTATPPIYSVAGTYRVTGGTGRFNGASGSGTLSGLENLETRQGQLKLSGTISY